MKSTETPLYIEDHPDQTKLIRWGILIGALMILALIAVAFWDLTLAFLGLWLFVIIPIGVLWLLIMLARYRTSQ